ARALPILGDEPEAHGFDRGLAAVPRVELAQDRADVVADRPFGENQPRGDLGVAHAFGEQLEHLELPRRQARRILAGGRPGPPGEPTDAALAQTSRDDRRRRPRSELLELLQRPAELCLVAGVGPCKCSLIGAPRLVPEGGRTRPVARELRGEGLCGLCRNGLVASGPTAPEAELAQCPRVPGFESEPEG